MGTIGNRLKGALLVMGGLVVSTGAAGTAEARHKSKTAAAATGTALPKAFNRKVVEDHIRNHQRYPADKATMIAECDNLSEFTDADRAWFTSKLPEGTYKNPDAVIVALGLDAPSAGAKKAR